VTIFMVDQRIGEMSTCIQRKAEYRVVVGNEVGLSGRFPEPEKVVRYKRMHQL
jgi:hypothetical protein